MDIEKILQKMTLEDKIALCPVKTSGKQKNAKNTAFRPFSCATALTACASRRM